MNPTILYSNSRIPPSRVDRFPRESGNQILPQATSTLEGLHENPWLGWLMASPIYHQGSSLRVRLMHHAILRDQLTRAYE